MKRIMPMLTTALFMFALPVFADTKLEQTTEVAHMQSESSLQMYLEPVDASENDLVFCCLGFYTCDDMKIPEKYCVDGGGYAANSCNSCRIKQPKKPTEPVP